MPLFWGTQIQVRHRDGFSRMMAQTTRTCARMCLFGNFSHCTPFRGSKNPKTPILRREKAFSGQTREIEKRAYYQNYCIDSNRILHSDKDHQMTFVGGPHTPITNPRWRTAAIFKYRKIVIYRPRFNRFLRNLARWSIPNLLTTQTVKNLKFQKSKMAAATILKNRKLTCLIRGLSDFY